ncbi:hypothetical protein FHS27_004746 [Rhodopirellula rubra]|uniref:Uncharacterized protein n=1 Tax=Aporhodopirellula rubra TaxID=980271 RepID=A0A7W5H6T6_9BACT|nr:hypothetical protein [Aporhodopirellula rubra]MBB3208912.1 hypothetical protein [Aporhodopirellula rubra]
MLVVEPTTTVMTRAALPQVPLSDRKAHRFNAMFETKARKINETLSTVLEVDIPPPDLPTIRGVDDLVANADLWSSMLERTLLANDCGTLTLREHDAIATFFETEKKLGVMNHRFDRVKHTHRLVNYRMRYKESVSDIPRKGRKILAALEEVGLGRDVRILTGDLVEEDLQTVKSWSERSAIGSTVDSAIRSGRNIRRNISDAADAIQSGLMHAIDPCIVLGTCVVWGWKL